MRSKKVALDCVGQVADRKPKQGVVKINFDPTPEGFLYKSKGRQSPVGISISPDSGNKEIEKICLFGVVKGITIELEDVTMPAERIADLEFLMREKTVCLLHFEGEWAELFEEPQGSVA